MKRLAATISFFLIALALALPVQAAARNDSGLYAVHGVDVDATADSAGEARDKAIAQGARKGIEQLLRQLSGNDDSKIFPIVTDKIAGPMVQDFEVESERSSSGRYIARLGFRYKPEGVRALLAQSGGHYVSTRAPLVLVVPVYRSAAGDLLWQPANQWRDAWKDAPASAGLVPVVVPAGTPDDAQIFTASDLADVQKLAALADRYKAQNAVIVYAMAASAAGEPGEGLKITLSNGGGPDLSFKSDGAPTPSAALSQAVAATLAQMDAIWKQHALKGATGAIAFKTPVAAQPDASMISDASPSGGNGYALRAPLSSPGEWANLRAKLGQISGVTRVDLKSLTRDDVTVVVVIAGDEEQLTQSLAGSGLTLGPPSAVPADDGQTASMVPSTGPGAGLIYPLSSTGIISMTTQSAPENAEIRVVGNSSRTGRSWLFWTLMLVVIGGFLYLVRSVLLPFIMGIAVAYFFDPLVRRLQKSGLPRWASALLVLAVFVVIFAAGLVVVLPIVEKQVTQLIAVVPKWVAQMKTTLVPQIDAYMTRMGIGEEGDINQAIESYGGKAVSEAGIVLGSILTGGLAVLDLLSLLLVTPVVAFYLLRDWDAVEADLDRSLPRHHAATLRALFREIDRTLSGFIRGQALVCAIQATYYAIVLSIAGLNFGVLVGVATGILTFIPYLGAMIGLITGLLIALAEWHDTLHVLIIFGCFALGQMLEANVITPKLVGDRIGLHPVWIIFAVLAGGALFGFAGILIAVPIAAVLGVLIRFAMRLYLSSRFYRGREPVAAVEGDIAANS